MWDELAHSREWGQHPSVAGICVYMHTVIFLYSVLDQWRDETISIASRVKVSTCLVLVIHPTSTAKEIKEYCLLFRIACSFLFQASHINTSLYVGGKGAMVISTGHGCLTLNCDATSSELFSHMFLTKYGDDWLMFYEKTSIWNVRHVTGLIKCQKKQRHYNISSEDCLLRFGMSAKDPKIFFDRVKLQECAWNALRR